MEVSQVKYKYEIVHGNCLDVLRNMEKTDHASAYTIKIPENCIYAGCPDGGTVLYPFAGLNRTGESARKLLKNYIGIELDPNFVELSRKKEVKNSILYSTTVKQSI